MRFYLLFIILLLSANISAQEFKPYKIKSGKIEYELRKHASKSHYSNVNGVEKRSNEIVPYVAEIINYYWDNYGDVAFEESWEVAKFGGDPTTKKKKYERLWIGDYRYYYNFEQDRLVDDPFHIKIECRDRFQYYQVVDSWVETIYMGASKNGIVQMLGKDATYYKINNSHDMYVWKGLVMKDESFSTKRNGDRLMIDRAKIATKIDTGLVFDKSMFDLIRLEKDRFYQSVDKDAINSYLDGEPNTILQVQESGFEMKEGDIILFVTSDAHIGKLKVLKINKEALTIKYVTYDDYGDVFTQVSNLNIPNNFTCELDEGRVNEDKMYLQDFTFEYKGNPLLIPFPTLGFYLVKESRK